jgi:hypothetical protein
METILAFDRRRRFAELDAVLEPHMGPGRIVSFEDPVPAKGFARACQPAARSPSPCSAAGRT